MSVIEEAKTLFTSKGLEVTTLSILGKPYIRVEPQLKTPFFKSGDMVISALSFAISQGWSPEFDNEGDEHNYGKSIQCKDSKGRIRSLISSISVTIYQE